MSLIKIFLILLINNYGILSDIINQIWEPESLYDYTKKYFLDNNNPDKSINLKHMIVDPENYLKNNNLSDIYSAMEFLYNKYKINNYIFIISNIEIKKYKLNSTKELDMDKETERFLSKFNYIMYRENNYYDDSMTLMSMIFVNEAKIKMRTGLDLRNIIQEKDLINIITAREIDLLEGNYYKVIYELINDFHKIYLENNEYYNSYYYKNKSKIIFSCIFILLTTVFIFIYANYLPKGEREQKIQDFIYQNKNVKYKILFNSCCPICLSFFMPEKEKLKIENYLDKDLLKREKTKIFKCGHIFHKNCIKDWEKNFKECPLCIFDKNIKNNNKDDYLLKNIINDFVEIQRMAFPHKINKKQCNRIINNFLNDNETKIF